ncbi:MAG: beta strand repeat-containing protein [Alphaproteobacteria bacterium]
MKYSRTALRELTRLYRAVLLAAIVGTVAVAGTAKAEWSGNSDTITNGDGSVAKIWNEASGGGAQYTNATAGTVSFVGVNNGDNGIDVQIYAKDSSTNVGTRLNVNTDGIYYTTGGTAAEATNTPAQELVTVGTVASKATYNAGATYADGTIGKAIQDLATTSVGTISDSNGNETSVQSILGLSTASGSEGQLIFNTAVTNSNLSNGTATAPTTVVQALENIDKSMGQIHGLQAAIQTLDAKAGGNLASGTTVEDHLTALDAAIGDRQYVTNGGYAGSLLANNQSVATSVLAVANQVDTNTAAIATKQNALTANNGIDITSDTISVVAGNGIEVGASGVAVKAADTSINVAAGGISVAVDGSTIELGTSGLQIKDGGITTAKLNDASVTEAKIADNAVTTNKIADSSVTLAKLGSDVSTTTAASGDTKLMTSGGVYDIVNVGTAGNYIAAGTDVASNLSALDTAVKTNADAILTKAGLDVANTFSQTNTFGTTIGSQVVINNNGTMTVDGLLTANGGISTTDLTTSGDASVGGDLTVTGSTNMADATFTSDNGITITNATTPAISTTLVSENINGHNALHVTVSGTDSAVVVDNILASKDSLTVFDASYNELFVADANGIEVSDGTNTTFQVDAATGDTTLTGLLTANGGISTTNLTTSGNATVGGNLAVTGDTTFTGKATFGTSGFDLGGNTVDAIDTDGSAVAAGTATTLATAATIKAGAKDADYTATGTNITGTTLGTALDNLDAAIGDRTAYTNEYNIAAGDDVATSLDDLDTAIGDRTYTNGYNIASSDDVSTSLDDLDTIIGDVASVANTNGNIGGANIAAKLDAIDTNMGALATMNHAAFTATPADITSGVNDLATNMATAMGGAFTAGAWTDTVAPAAPNSYAYTASTNVMDAINQVAGNVGTAAQLTTAGTNGVAVANSVNANMDAVNKTIGDITTLNAGTGSTGNAITNGTGTAPTTVVAALNNIDATLGQIHGLKNGNSNLQADSNLASGTTVEDHLVSLDDAIGNRNYASAAYITPGESVADSLSVLDTQLASVHYDLGRLENEVRGGFAAAAAMAALVPNARAAGDTQIAVGTGNYRDRVGFALGAFHYINDNVLINAGAAYGGSKSTTFKAGITFGW